MPYPSFDPDGMIWFSESLGEPSLVFQMPWVAREGQLAVIIATGIGEWGNQSFTINDDGWSTPRLFTVANYFQADEQPGVLVSTKMIESGMARKEYEVTLTKPTKTWGVMCFVLDNASGLDPAPAGVLAEAFADSGYTMQYPEMTTTVNKAAIVRVFVGNPRGKTINAGANMPGMIIVQGWIGRSGAAPDTGMEMAIGIENGPEVAGWFPQRIASTYDPGNNIGLPALTVTFAIASPVDPAAPTPLSPANGAAVDIWGTPTFTWKHNPAPGGAKKQQGFALRRKLASQTTANYLSVSNSTFEAGTTTWTNNSGTTVSVSSDVAHSGLKSLKVVASSTGSISFRTPIGTSGIAVKPSTWYLAGFWVRGAKNIIGRQVDLTLNEYNSAGTYLRSITTSNWDISDEWTYLDVGNTVGSDCAYIALTVTIHTVAATGETYYFDDMEITNYQYWFEGSQMWNGRNYVWTPLESWTFGAQDWELDAGANDEDYVWSIGIVDTNYRYSPFSGDQRLFGKLLPELDSITPTDSSVIRTTTPEITWNLYSPDNAQQVAYRVLVYHYGDYTKPRWDSGVVTLPAPPEFPSWVSSYHELVSDPRVKVPEGMLADNDWYIAFIYVQDILGQWTATSNSFFPGASIYGTTFQIVNAEVPGVPDITVTPLATNPPGLQLSIAGHDNVLDARDGDFEASSYGNWTQFGSGSIGLAHIDPSQADYPAYVGSGNMSIMLYRNSTTGTLYAGTSKIPYAPIKPNTSYTARCRIRAKTTSRSWTIALTWMTEAGADISTITSAAAADSNSAFTNYAVTGTSPANAKYFRVMIATADTCALNEYHYIDSVSVSPGGTSFTTASDRPPEYWVQYSDDAYYGGSTWVDFPGFTAIPWGGTDVQAASVVDYTAIPGTYRTYRVRSVRKNSTGVTVASAWSTTDDGLISSYSSGYIVDVEDPTSTVLIRVVSDAGRIYSRQQTVFKAFQRSAPLVIDDSISRLAVGSTTIAALTASETDQLVNMLSSKHTMILYWHFEDGVYPERIIFKVVGEIAVDKVDPEDLYALRTITFDWAEQLMPDVVEVV